MSTLAERNGVSFFAPPTTGATSGEPAGPLWGRLHTLPLIEFGKLRLPMKVGQAAAEIAVVQVESAADADIGVAANAFAGLDELRADDSLFKEGVASLYAEAPVVRREEICSRLMRLLDLYKEDYDGRALSSESLASFRGFLKTKPSVRLPTITASGAGYIYASWKEPERTGRRVGIHFLPGGRARYTVFVRNIAHEERLDEHSGAVTADSLAATLDALGVGAWLNE